MKTSQPATQDDRPNGAGSPGRRKSDGAKGHQPKPRQVDVDLPTEVRSTKSSDVAARVLAKLDELDGRISRLAEDRSASHGHDQDLSFTIQQLQATIATDSLSLATRFGEALAQQNKAIADIAATLRKLEHSFPAGITVGQSADRKTAHDIDSAEQANTERADDQSGDVTGSSASPSGNSTWDEIRNAFLQQHEPKPVAAEPIEAVREAEAVPVPPPEDLPEIPSITDIDGLDEEELRKVMLDRETLISALVKRLQRRARTEPVLSPEQLNELRELATEEQQQQIQRGLSTLNEQHRLGELELSLERARVSRQLATLEVTRERLEATARSLGLTINSDGTLEGEIDPNLKRGSKGRRWLGAMGFGG
ncbi:MAG: hypothetical protein KDA81_16785 [Planctomycetaceae bacterium]|nr:hypothetical protein [Planctomycetaceae bacterium]